MPILFSDLPDVIPVFPLDGVLLLPRGDLPLNIFEPRYVAMVEDALLSPLRLIGMVQPTGERAANGSGLFKIGCVGRITSFQEFDQGRYLITLTGISRFRILTELEMTSGYRRVRVNWQEFVDDTKPFDCLGLDRARLTHLLKTYFDIHGLSIDWKLVEDVADERLMTSLAMICPLESLEKQALLEAPCCKSRADLLVNLLEMAIQSKDTHASKH